MLGVLSSTDLLTGTWDLVSGLPELAQEAGEFFGEACFSLGKDPIPVNWGKGEGEKRTKGTGKKLKQLLLLSICLQVKRLHIKKIHIKRLNLPHIDMVKNSVNTEKQFQGFKESHFAY